MATIVRHTQDNRGCTSSICPKCRTMFVYWDDEDLDENGDLLCYCEEEALEAPPMFQAVGLLSYDPETDTLEGA